MAEMEKISSRNGQVNGPIIIIVTLIGVVFIAWALGQSICWATTGKDFQFYVNLGKGIFKLGCE